MRTRKKFTPKLLRLWMEQGRGQGSLGTYVPWHRISRGDPASRGRSHLEFWSKTGRFHHLLSDGEQIAFFFAVMLEGTEDIREQFPLLLKSGQHELSHYTASYLGHEALGTEELASILSIRHPQLRNKDDKESWVPTTDLLVAGRSKDGRLSLLAVAVKPENDLSKRERQLLQLEKEYWERRGVKWILITPSLYSSKVGECLQRTAPWVVAAENVFNEEIEKCTELVQLNSGRDLTHMLRLTCSQLGVDMDRAQKIFWQSIWYGKLPVDLRRGWRPSEPVILLSKKQFNELNPLAAGRTVCI